MVLAKAKRMTEFGHDVIIFLDSITPTTPHLHVALLGNRPRDHRPDVKPTGTRKWMATSTFNMIVGRNGLSLNDKWSNEGTRTFLGLHSHGYPNLFIVSGPQGGGGSFNFTNAIETHGDYILWMLKTMRKKKTRYRIIFSC